ncbi:MAG TPA: sialate O-acetylesterase [Pirellulales bacterium]|nr:sialate O-acetylesterase [Pirellulales bacterium]
MIFHSAVLVGAENTANGITVWKPVNWEVSQRQSAAQGLIYVAGQCAADERIQWQLSGQPLTGALAKDWQPLANSEPSASADSTNAGQQTDASGRTRFSGKISAPAGGWFRLELRAVRGDEVTSQATIEHLGVGEVFVVAGQSNSANYGAEKQQSKSGLVTAFDGKTWRIADDPQPGAGGQGGSFMPSFGDAMAEKFHVPIGIVALGVGSTSVREWLPKGEKVDHQTTTGKGLKEIGPGQWEALGNIFAKLPARLTALGPHGCRAVLWHQGESDAGQRRPDRANADRQISGDDYVRYMAVLVKASRQAAGWDVPWFTAQATYHSEQDTGNTEFRAAQKSLWDSHLTLEGPDTDALGEEFRKGVHFNAQGLPRHGALWAEKVAPWLESQLKTD